LLGARLGLTLAAVHVVTLDRPALFALADFIAEHNAATERSVASLEERPDAVREQVNGFAEGSFCACAAYADDKPLGVFVAEYDVEQRRAWLMGPIVAASDEAVWRATAEALLQHVVGLLPAGVERRQFFFDERARLHAQFAVEHGFVPRADAQLSMSLSLPGRDFSDHDAVGATPSDLRAEFVSLHDETFPGAYWSGRQLLEQADRLWLFVHREDDSIGGYITGEISTANREGYVHFMGVREDRRRTGVAAGLLCSAAHRLRRDHGVDSLRLTVRSTNDAAVQLYLKLGFDVLRSMRAFERQLIPAPGP
jgi:ribosomal protein S18 acetylase RimI-like enzyme